ncbi:uncharacterized protein LOC128883315 [Hylaeus volcanicus]|uniref:uncharacterized protein LOC128883315 n=1 Tax=Hylaeus volcanicus TaxID=313075 RepID=UPI0023B7D005|nr:uncharacterized protein LOC128883315 [Hylaeus volcanicus]
MIDTVLNTFAETLFGYTTDESVSTVLSNPQYYSSETPIFLKIDTLSLKKTLLEQDTCPLTIETALLSHCEDVLTQGVGFFIKLHCPLFLMWLKDCYSRCLADCIKVSPKFRNILRKLQEKNGVDLSCIQTLVLRFAVLSFQCPFFFIQSDDKDYDQNELDELTAESVILLYETTSNTNQFLSALFECLEKESQEDFEKVICNVLSHFKKKISSKKELKSVNDNTFNSLCMFINTEKNIPRIVGQQLSVKQKNLLTKQKKSFAVALASCTLLGNILWFTPLDAIHFVHDPSRSCSQQYFNLNICQNARHLAKSIDNVRENALQVVDTAHIFVTLLCRNGARYECLEWISSIAKGNQKRVQQGISSQLEFFSTMSVSMEAFALQYHGFTGSGFNFNLFWMCLKLLEPIKLHKTSSIEIEYLLSEEAQTLLQPYLSESRLCFLEELHELEVGFRASPENKKTPKFSTQIFFVSFLCLRYLFRPLLNEFSHLRELLHSRQSEMASSKHSTPRQKSYHELLGEYMCFQSLIAHPMFLKSWWYFVDLTVTWLFKQLDITSFTMPNNTKNFRRKRKFKPSFHVVTFKNLAVLYFGRYC